MGQVQICTTFQTNNNANIPPFSVLQAGCPSCCPANSVKALKAYHHTSCTQNQLMPHYVRIHHHHWVMLFFFCHTCT